MANQVKNTIIKGYRGIQECYNKFLDGKPPKTDGRVTIDWEVQKDGSVSTPQLVSSDFADEGLVSCMVDQIKSYDFPAPPFGIKKYVAHTFVFKMKTNPDNGNEQKK